MGLGDGLAVVGAIFDDDLGTSSGGAFVFAGGPGGWDQVDKLVAPDGEPYDFFGCSVAVSGDRALVGAREDDAGALDSGSAYVFTVPTADFACLSSGAEYSVMQSISLSLEDDQKLRMNVSPGYAEHLYLILGSLSGTVPGVDLGNTLIPLNPDPYYQFTLTTPNSILLPESLGFLEPDGETIVFFESPAGSNPALLGLTVNHAFLVLDFGPGSATGTGAVLQASNPLPVLLIG